MESVAEKNVGPAVAVVINPRGGREVIASLFRKQMTVIAESVAEVGEQFGSGGRGQEQVGLAVAVIISPDGGAAAADRPGQTDFAQRFAAVLQKRDLAAADEAQIRFAVAVEIDAGNGLSLRIDPAQSRKVSESGHAVEPDEIFAAPADEVALGIVILQLETGFEPLNPRPPQVQIILVAVYHAGHDHFLAGDDIRRRCGKFIHITSEAAQ